MKKLAIVILAVLLVASMAACAAKENDLTSINDYMEPDYTHDLKDKDNNIIGTVTFGDVGGDSAEIVDYLGKHSPHSITVPKQVGEKGSERTVVGIGDEAFFFCTTATEIIIPDTVEYIGKFAFAGCNNLTSITIPASVKSIDESAFYGCTALKEVKYLGTAVESIGNYAFSGCTALTSANLPEGVASIGDGAFMNCEALVSFKAPSTLKSIGELAFYGCNALNAKDAVDLSAALNISVTTEKDKNGKEVEVIAIGDFAFVSVNKINIKVPEDAESAAAKYVAAMQEYVESNKDAE